jgi:riboflavin kinase/FMN adenylyltransferase
MDRQAEMKIYRSFRNIGLKSAIVTWGVFDGVHRGHQLLIKNVVRWARKINKPSLVITFQNHPERVLNSPLPEKHSLFITSLEHRLLLLQELGVDYCLVLKFTKRLSRLSGRAFVNRIIKTLSPAGVVVTDNVRFGRNRSGNIDTLRNILAEKRIGLRVIKPLKYGAKATSSSRIRKAIQSGQLKDATRMLGRTVTILGTVVRGKGRGRLLGYPTANIDPHNEILPPHGVYTGYATVLSEPKPRRRQALINIGTRPTFRTNVISRIIVEAYLLNYPEKALYGRDILLEIIRRIRDERRFQSADLLVNQIKQDLSRI